MTQKFDPGEWLDREEADRLAARNHYTASHNTSSPEITAEVDTVIARLEADFTDITSSYANWLHVGFAFANEFGEKGRAFYHRVSRFYTGYTMANTDKQYDQCLKSHGHGITIKTFFHMAKQAGVDISGNKACKEVNSSQYSGVSAPRTGGGPSILPSISPSKLSAGDAPAEEEKLPTLPDFIFDRLPEFFKKVVMMAGSKEERDMLFLGSLVTLSSCLPKFSGYYANKKVYPNLYLYVTAPASAGKGNLVMCRHLVNPVDEEKSQQGYLENLLHDQQMREYNAMKNKDLSIEKPVKPPVRMLFIPANNSTTGFYQLLADNEGSGLLFETEGDTIVQTFRTDYGNFSDGVRKAYHHEFICYYRRTDREHVRILCPRLSIVISSTLGQLPGLIPSVENGLASRFMFYNMNMCPDWDDVFSRKFSMGMDDHFKKLGQEFYSLYNSLKKVPAIDFSLTEKQKDRFNSYFSQLQGKYLVLQGMDSIAIIRRLGLMAFRMMMVLTAMRIPETGDFSPFQQCMDEDFESVLSIIGVLVRHASYVLSQLPPVVKTIKGQNSKERFFDSLTGKFSRQDYVALGKSMDISERTAQNYISSFCDKGLILREQRDTYTKENAWIEKMRQ